MAKLAEELDVGLRHYALLSPSSGATKNWLRCSSASLPCPPEEPRREVPPLDAWRALASTLILASYLTSRNGEDELFATWARRASGKTFKEGVACLRRLLTLRASPVSAAWDLGRFKAASYDVLCQNTSARADRRRQMKGGALLCHAGSPGQATRRAPLAGLAFADCIGPDPGNFQRRPLYPNQKCLVVLARCGGLACEHIPGGRQAVLTHLRRLFRRTRRYHDIQGVELALLDHFQLDLSDMESEAKELAEVLLDGIGKDAQDSQEYGAQLRLLVALLKRKSPEWWQLPGERLGGLARALRRLKRSPLACDFDAWASPDKLSREQVISCLTSCRVKGTTFPQVLSSLRHWKVTTADLPERERTALKCALAWLRQPRVAFDSAVMLFSSLNLQASPKALSAFESEALLALGILVRTDRRALEAALQALSSDPVLSAPPAAWAWAAKALHSNGPGPLHWPAWSARFHIPTLQLEVPLRLFQKDEDLKHSVKILTSSDVVGLDAEWPPNTFGISILQFAVWHEVHIWDLQTLDPEVVRRHLPTVLFSPSIRKIGFSFRTSDWPRLGCYAGTLRSLVDLDLLWARQHPTEPVGLKGLVAKLLQKQLDKTEQCSNWAQRPLSEQQLRYGALDAHCLLQLLKAMEPSEQELLSIQVDLDQEPETCIESSDELSGVEIRVGRVEASWPIPGSRHLSGCRVSLGRYGQRQLVQGLPVSAGQRVFVICNLLSRELWGLPSQAGLLAARFADGRRALAEPPQNAELGEVLGTEKTWAPIDLTLPDNPWLRASARLSTSKGLVLLDGQPLKCAGEICSISDSGDGTSGEFT